MRYCDRHIGAILRACEGRGMGSMCCDPRDERTIEGKVGDGILNGWNFDNFDPVGGVYFLVGNACFARFGSEAMELLVPEELGLEQCPMCYFDRHCDWCPDHERLIETAADITLGWYRKIAAQ